MWISDLFRARRWFFISLAAAIAIPSLTLLTLSQFADEMSEEEALEVASVAVKNYVDENPPRKGWRATNIYIGTKHNVIVDVHVSRYDHAQVINERNQRIFETRVPTNRCLGISVVEWQGSDLGQPAPPRRNHHQGTVPECQEQRIFVVTRPNQDCDIRFGVIRPLGCLSAA